MAFEKESMVGLPQESLEPVFCVAEPVQISGPMTCRRGRGQRTECQGQPIPTCDGVIISGMIGMRKGFLCSKCRLSHGIIALNGIAFYGALL